MGLGSKEIQLPVGERLLQDDQELVKLFQDIKGTYSAPSTPHIGPASLAQTPAKRASLPMKTIKIKVLEDAAAKGSSGSVKEPLGTKVEQPPLDPSPPLKPGQEWSALEAKRKAPFKVQFYNHPVPKQ